MKKNFKRGAGEFIGFTITSIFLITLLILFVSFSTLENGLTALENCTDIVARDVVVVKDLSAARKQAQAQASEMLKAYKNCSNVKTKVTYAPGCDTWEKGAFIRVSVSAKVKTYDPFTTSKHTYSTLVMVEKNSEKQIEEAIGTNMDIGFSGNDQFFGSLESIKDEMLKHHFKYSNSVKGSFAEAIKSRHTSNCASFVSWAMQDYGILPKGRMVWLGDRVHGSGSSYIKSHKDLYKILYPNKVPAAANLQPGDICGFMLGSVPHTAVFVKYKENGDSVWYSGGNDSCTHGNYVESKFKQRHFRYMEKHQVKVVIRILNGPNVS